MSPLPLDADHRRGAASPGEGSPFSNPIPAPGLGDRRTALARPSARHWIAPRRLPELLTFREPDR
jgi:hypothetical protein